MTPDVLVTRDGAIATVTLHNPPRRNALTVAFAAGADIAEFAAA